MQRNHSIHEEKNEDLLKQPRIHPGLPTRREVQINPDIFYSDHVPQLMTVPLKNRVKLLKLMSYNVYQEGNPCGYGNDLLRDERYDSAHRKERIAQGIKLCVDENDVEVILLQEATQEHRVALIPHLGREWTVSEVSKHGLVTCYKNILQGETTFETTNSWSPNEMTSTFDFLQITNLYLPERDLPFASIVNIHGDFQVQEKEQVFSTLLKPLNENQTFVVAGDFNIPMSDMQGQVGVTGMVPPEYNHVGMTLDGGQVEENPTDKTIAYEIPDATDGGLYKTLTGPITKMTPQALDITTGKLYTASQLTNNSSKLDYTRKVSPVYCPEAEIEQSSTAFRKNIAIYAGTPLAATAIGALWGTFVFPGIGTLVGAAMGAVLGALVSAVIYLSSPSEDEPPVFGAFDFLDGESKKTDVSQSQVSSLEKKNQPSTHSASTHTKFEEPPQSTPSLFKSNYKKDEKLVELKIARESLIFLTDLAAKAAENYALLMQKEREQSNGMLYKGESGAVFRVLENPEGLKAVYQFDLLVLKTEMEQLPQQLGHDPIKLLDAQINLTNESIKILKYYINKYSPMDFLQNNASASFNR